MKFLIKILSLLAALSMLLAACGGAPAPTDVSVTESVELIEELVETQIPISEGDMKTLVDGNNAFAVDIFQSLRAGDGNLVLSPYSISLALAMTYAGARGETESQMMETLHFTQGQGATHPSFNMLGAELAQRGEAGSKDGQPMQLNIVNSIWAERAFTFDKQFLNLVSTSYGAGIRFTNFITQYEDARREINAWVSDETNGRIQDLLAEGIIDSMTRMALVNAIYFKANWLEPFDERSTSNALFHLLDGSRVTVPTMHKQVTASYASGDGCQALELAYAGETAAMDIIVPDEGNYEAFESALSIGQLNKILGGMKPTTVMLGLPKFGYAADFALADTLETMGMPDAFDMDKADFSGMTGGRDLYISTVVHKAFVSIDEKGTEAAAATAVIMSLRGAFKSEVTLNVDRPFIFVIRDLPSGQILFIGRVLDPSK